GDPVDGPASGGLHCEQDVGRLGLAVCQPRVVRAAVEVDVVEVDVPVDVSDGADRDDAGVAGGDEGVAQAGGQGEVAEVVGGELHLPALAGPRQRGGHDAG